MGFRFGGLNWNPILNAIMVIFYNTIKSYENSTNTNYPNEQYIDMDHTLVIN